MSKKECRVVCFASVPKLPGCFVFSDNIGAPAYDEQLLLLLPLPVAHSSRSAAAAILDVGNRDKPGKGSDVRRILAAYAYAYGSQAHRCIRQGIGTLSEARRGVLMVGRRCLRGMKQNNNKSAGNQLGRAGGWCVVDTVDMCRRV